jgi:homoserine dehydrogenase
LIRTYNLALAGFGNVGKEFVRLMLAKRQLLRTQYGIDWKLTGLASRTLGWCADPAGFDASALLEAPGGSPQPGTRVAGLQDWLSKSQASVLFEATSINRETGQPAIDHLRAALEAGAHAISANKGPVVHAYHALRELAAARGRQFLFESAVMDGVPVFSLFPGGLPAVELRGFRGLLNSTSNVVLTEMENGLSFDDAVKKAQQIGVAETDPSNDLEGWDAAVKVTALAIVLMDATLKLGEVERTGIRNLTAEQVRAARAEGKRYKLVCRARKTPAGGVLASVGPELLPLSDPLALLEGATSALQFDLDVFGLSIIEHKPGVVATAYGLLADFIRAVKA